MLCCAVLCCAVLYGGQCTVYAGGGKVWLTLASDLDDAMRKMARYEGGGTATAPAAAEEDEVPTAVTFDQFESWWEAGVCTALCCPQTLLSTEVRAARTDGARMALCQTKLITAANCVAVW
jgi:hypothetical protein